MNCEHDWQQREPGREETDLDVFNIGVVEWVCDKCGKYETRIGNAPKRPVHQGKEQG